MIAIALPPGDTLDRWGPQLEEAKPFQDRVAVYWYLRASSQCDSRVCVRFALKRSRILLKDEVERLNRAIVLSRSRPPAVHYDVALSFAGEDRKYVHRVAEALAAKGVKVFYDNFEEADLWGKNLYSHLAKVYGRQARFTVIFVSKAYGKKLWTKHEREAAQAKAFTQNSEYILPVRIDDTKLPGILNTTGYVLASKNSPARLASLIVDKLAKSANPSPTLTRRMGTSV
jgi:TIR domain